jgi:hypothetical protein
MGDLQRRSESVRPVRTVFAEQSWLESLSRKVDVHTGIVCNRYSASHTRCAVRSRAKALFRDTRQLCFAVWRSAVLEGEIYL